MVKDRRFTIHDARKADGCPTKFKSKEYSGIYENKAPGAAAMKALTQLCRSKKTKGQCTLFITMREITQGNNKKANGEPKLYHYKVKREKLAKPLELKGRVIEYKNTCKSIKELPKKEKGCKKSSGKKRSSKSSA
tara:strand:+ start:1012 stop:1416 length:405 start_codon:yes stop_codon:yes gene_type:complete